MAQKYKTAIDILKKAKEDIHAILDGPDDENHRIRLTNNLQRDIDNIGLLTGVADMDQPAAADVKPATTLAGRPLKVPVHPGKNNLKPSEEKTAALKAKIETAYAEFPTTPAKDILKNYEDMVIRGVAKKVQMKVSAKDPEKLTLPFINQIKKEIQVFSEKQTAAEKEKSALTEKTGSAADDSAGKGADDDLLG